MFDNSATKYVFKVNIYLNFLDFWYINDYKLHNWVFTARGNAKIMARGMTNTPKILPEITDSVKKIHTILKCSLNSVRIENK